MTHQQIELHEIKMILYNASYEDYKRVRKSIKAYANLGHTEIEDASVNQVAQLIYDYADLEWLQEVME